MLLTFAFSSISLWLFYKPHSMGCLLESVYSIFSMTLFSPSLLLFGSPPSLCCIASFCFLLGVRWWLCVGIAFSGRLSFSSLFVVPLSTKAPSFPFFLISISPWLCAFLCMLIVSRPLVSP